jgi:putative ABC transport system permease protein
MRAAWILFSGLNLAYFRTHVLRTALSTTGIALGVTLLFGAIIDNASATGSLGKQTQSLQGSADLEVTTPALAGVPDSMAQQTRAIKGVAVAAPVLQQQVVIRGPRGSAEVIAVGYDQHLVDLAAIAVDRTRVHKLRDGPGLAAPAQLLDELGRPGDGRMRFVSEGRASAVLLVGEIPADIGAALNQGHMVALPLPLAQDLLGHPGRVTSLFVRSTDRSVAGVASLRTRLENQLGDHVQVLDANHTVQELQISTEQIRSTTNLLALLAVLLGGYVVFITMSMAAVERRREFAIMLALGDSPRRLLTRFLVESALLGLAGGFVGIVGGYYVGRYLAGGTPDYLQQAYSFRTDVEVPAWGVAASVGAGLVAAVSAALGPALSILRLPPAEALRAQPLGEAPRTGRSVLVASVSGIILVAAGTAGGLVFPKIGTVFAGVTFIGAVLVLPEVFTRALRLVARWLLTVRFHAGSGVAQLVGANLLHSPRRTVAAVSAAALSLSLVIGFAAVNDEVTRAVDSFASKFNTVDLVADPTTNFFAQVPFGPGVLDQVSRIKGVRDVHPETLNFIRFNNRRVLMNSADPGLGHAFTLDFREGQPSAAYQALAGDGIIVSTQVAQLDGAHVGDNVTLPSPTGPHSFRVSGVIEALSWIEGVLIIGNDAFHRYFQQPEWNQLFVQVAPGTSVAELRDNLRATLGPYSDVRLGADFGEVARTTNSAAEAPFTNMRNVSVVVAILAVLNTLLVAVLQRRREIGVLIAIGLHRRQLAMALFAEAAIMVAVALVAGAVLGTTLQAMGIAYLDTTTGLPIHFHFELSALMVGAASALVIAVAGSLYPARAATRVPVLEAIAYE